MTRTLDTLPLHLKNYCIEHDSLKYNARDHSAWRYIMHRALNFFTEHAVGDYQAGLKATGITVEKIPSIDNIDKALQEFGWGAVPVVGFIPPWAFLEFQARCILPIATDMRSVDHIAYTPAPDIVHEAAGHAPILPDKDYREYLSYYAKLGTKAIYSRQDLDLYEAIRYLSDIKEKPESSPELIAEAELRLASTIKRCSYVSEATKVGRMSWWTAEYGLVGSLEKPKIYGAGLLSSVGESKSAMTAAVKKIPLSMDCTNYSYNITEPQPQLFVAENMQHLLDVLAELDDTLAYKKGGAYALKLAKEAQAVTTAVLDSGIEISGILEDYNESLGLLKYRGPIQLCMESSQLEGHGSQDHPQGITVALGRWKLIPETPAYRLSESNLSRNGVVKAKNIRLELSSGLELRGELVETKMYSDKLIYLRLKGAKLLHNKKSLLNESEQKEFIFVIGETVESIYGGPADRESYGEHEIVEATTSPSRETPYTSDELEIFDLYAKVRHYRETAHTKRDDFVALAQQVLNKHPKEWLLLSEIYELVRMSKDTNSHPSFNALYQHLNGNQKFWNASQKELIENIVF